jgi:hypothetical protein
VGSGDANSGRGYHRVEPPHRNKIAVNHPIGTPCLTS